jgi:hemerythrin-like metal-binding protein
MVFAVWDDDLATGNVGIDADHKKLINIINTLYGAMSNGLGNAILFNIILELQKYTITHFTREEFILNSINYEDIDRHKSEHEFFIKKINRFMEDYQSNMVVLTVDLMEFLKSWLLDHIRESDMVALNDLRKV